MRIYLIRHGQTELNLKKCYYGWTDVPLTLEGRKQAEKMERFFSHCSLDTVIVSPLLRARETAGIVVAGRTKEIETDQRLMEQNFGIFEGCTYEQLQKKYPQELKKWNQDFAKYRIPKGESFLDVRKRIDSFLLDLSKRKGNLLIVAHKGTLGHFLASCLGLPLEGYWNFVFDQGCYSCIDWEDGYAIIRKLNQSISDGYEIK